jgi:hypothetical protein
MSASSMSVMSSGASYDLIGPLDLIDALGCPGRC